MDIKLEDIYFFISIFCGIIGICGIDGWMEFGTGLGMCLILLVVSAVCFYLGYLERGGFHEDERE